MDLATRKQTPTVRLRRLASELRTLRAAAGLTREEVNQRTAINSATLYRLEHATARPQRRTLLTLLDLYGVTDETKRTSLINIARESKQKNWLQRFESDLPEEYASYISFEDDARSLRDYQCLFVPGLLQTEAYARAVVRGTLPDITDEMVEKRVEVRMLRQEVLQRKPPIKLWAVMDEAVLRRQVGGVQVMRDQLEVLVEASRKPHITLQIIPFEIGAHPGMPGSFVVMDFPDPLDPALVYIDNMAGQLFLELEADVRRYSGSFEHLQAMALDPARSVKAIQAAAKAMT